MVYPLSCYWQVTIGWALCLCRSEARVASVVYSVVLFHDRVDYDRPFHLG